MSGWRVQMVALFVYAVAMAFVESAVVVYLRLLIPATRAATEVPFSALVYRTEVAREAATIVMLLAVAYLAFERWSMRALAFLWIFAIWDFCYYVFLKLIIGWPESLATKDVLFLIPVPWIAPVWFPIACSTVAFFFAGYFLIRLGGEAALPDSGEAPAG